MEKKNVYAGTGISRDDDPYKAGKEAVEMAIEKAGKAPDFGFVFCSGGKYGNNDKRIKKLVEGAHEAFMAANKKCKWMGCTTAGEISNYGFSQGSCVAMCLSSNYIHVGVGISDNVEKKPEDAGKDAIKEALKDLKTDKQVDSYISYLAAKRKSVEELMKIKPYYVIMLTQGPLINKNVFGREESIAKGISSIIGRYVPIIGGSAADDMKFEKVYVFKDGKVCVDSVVTMVVASDIHLGISLEHGYKPTTKSFIVTKVKDRIIYELNGKPAVKEFCKAAGINEAEFRKQPLAFSDKYILGVPDGTGNFFSMVTGAVVNNAIQIATSLEKNSMLALMSAKPNDLLDAARDSVKYAIQDSSSKKVAAVLMFDCSIRWLNLGKNVSKEIEMVKKQVGKDVPIVGFYTFGEQGLRHFGGACAHFTASTSSMVFTDKLFTEKNG
ncbi:MAG: FIST N-terminal domain-containing protein [Candidatus Nanoarchaeia archaeon]|nr:FIST N-terminal domain-containing protein [Candidatus Nanoarchaeia archaeon]